MSPPLLLASHDDPACLAHRWPIDRANAVRGAHAPHASRLPARRLRALRAACAPSFPLCRCRERSEALGPHVRPPSPCHGRGGALFPPRRANTVTRAHVAGLARTACSVARQAALHPASRASCARALAGQGQIAAPTSFLLAPGVNVRPRASVASPRSGSAARGHGCVGRRPRRHPAAARTGCAQPADAFAQSAGHRIEPVGAWPRATYRLQKDARSPANNTSGRTRAARATKQAASEGTRARRERVGPTGSGRRANGIAIRLAAASAAHTGPGGCEHMASRAPGPQRHRSRAPPMSTGTEAGGAHRVRAQEAQGRTDGTRAGKRRKGNGSPRPATRKQVERAESTAGAKATSRNASC
ncbi:hypothetical protein, conserved in T. vivax [Trypanosoma vivax Y486]|uniref:Uncharacterized protein n=1 Tax=Trypanosoma vivax (strain Y486) TaxID=1055687 RepID=F9WVK1_TRYVY|nr:hypothetical protein, conserved in T. vivax [Trypanosoma vivax Y486]|eukprot:CCD21609.1 hypothetical protein, conserved in T. vivax [Trypanosoma vivax Y486]